MVAEGAGGGRGSTTISVWIPLMAGDPGYQSVKYIIFLSIVLFMTWLSGHDTLASEPPYYYEYALMGYAALLAVAYLGFTARARDESEDEKHAGTRIVARLMDSLLNALYLALLTLPFLAVVRILTLMENREVILTLLLIVVCYTTYRFISLRLADMLRKLPLLLNVLQLSLFTLILFLSLIFYPSLSPFYAFHSITAVSRLIIGGGGFYHPLGSYLQTILIHCLILGALTSLELLAGRRVHARHGT